ncbi:MAG: DUF1595 domain-containing protein, partial [Myxococcota bacterium]
MSPITCPHSNHIHPPKWWIWVAALIVATTMSACTGEFIAPTGTGLFDDGDPSTDNPGSSEQPGDRPSLPPEVQEEINELPPTETPPPEDLYAFLPRRIRRLANAEIERSISDMVGVDVEIASRLPEDTRQRYFRPNAGQIVDPLLASSLAEIAQEVAEDAAQRNFAGLVDCTERDRACAERSIETLGLKAFRRPLDDDERTGLLALYDIGANTDGFDAGMTWVLEALLQSPSFLYLVELGDARAEDTVVLSSYETAAQLAFVTTGAPPDAALRAAAADGSILEASVRETHARRLLASEEGRLQMRR